MINAQTTVKPRIVVVEDEVIIACDIENSLKSLDYEVAGVASSGEEAVKVVEETHPDLVLMDIMLKSGMDGIEAAKQIRDRFDISVIYLTAYADDKTLQRAKVTEPLGYILKPIEQRGLRSAIEMALYNHKMEQKLKASEQWLETTLRSIGDAVIATDTKGYVTFMNPVAESLTCWEQEDAWGRPLKEVFKIKSEETGMEVSDPAGKVIREGNTVELEDNILTNKDGKEIPIGNSASPIRDDKGNIAGVVLVFRDVTERKRAAKELQALLVIDELTGLYNRRGLFALTEQQIKIGRRQESGMFLLYADLDGLKGINDTWGHKDGDSALIEVANVLKTTFRESDIIARIGGDEFVVFPVGTTADHAGIITTRLQKNVDDLNGRSTHNFKLSLSVGIAHYDLESSCSVDELLAQADRLMYKQKMNK